MTLGLKLKDILDASHQQIINSFSDDVLQQIRMHLVDFPEPRELMSPGFRDPVTQFPAFSSKNNPADLSLTDSYSNPCSFRKYIWQQTKTVVEHVQRIHPWPALPMYFDLRRNDQEESRIKLQLNGIDHEFAAVEYFYTDAAPSPDRLPELKAHYEKIWNEIVGTGIITTTQQDDAHDTEEEF